MKKILKQCGICTEDRATPLGAPVTSQLPQKRVAPSRTFDLVVVDFSGAIHLSEIKKLTLHCSPVVLLEPCA